MAYRIPGDGNVRIEFDGIMVGFYNEHTRTYEVGVLPAPMHTLSISADEQNNQGDTPGELQVGISLTLSVDEIPPSARFWRLEVEGQDADAELFIPQEMESGQPTDFLRSQLPMTDETAKDFRWIMDLERDFPQHPSPLSMRRDVLYPIIYVRNGLLYTFSAQDGENEFRALRFRSGRSGEFEDFGIAGPMVAADLQVEAGKTIVLRVDQPGEAEEIGPVIFRLPISAGKQYVIRIQNTPTESHAEHEEASNERSHFQLYYMLFGVSGDKWYEFKPGSAAAGPVPLSHHLHGEAEASADSAGTASPLSEMAEFIRHSIGTPKPYKCGVGTLGVRKTPLE